MSIRGTSIAAGKSLSPSTRSTLRQRVFRCILGRGSHGATLNEIEQELGMKGNTVRPRRRELEEIGVVVNSGKRRPTPSGRAAIVWVVPERIARVAVRKFQ